jgi:MFS transporter, PHS family, inorganic phosphate transporter
MLASVFLMQPVGQALAQLVGVWVLLGRDRQYGLSMMECGLNTANDRQCKQIIDGIWRIVIGTGAVPALLAIVFRFFLYDCGLYTLEVKNKPGTAFRDTQRIYGAPIPGAVGQGAQANGIAMMHSPGGGGTAQPGEPMPVQFSLQDLKNYFIRDGNWYYLLGTAASWFFLDISFYGFSLDKGSTLADLWATTGPVPINSNLSCWQSSIEGGNSTVQSWPTKGVPVWVSDNTQPCNDMYSGLLEQGKQYLLTVSLASIAGSACFIFAANRLPRRQWLTTSFLVLCVLFIVTGGVYYSVAHTKAAPASVVLVAVCYFVFNFGMSKPSTLAFVA